MAYIVMANSGELSRPIEAFCRAIPSGIKLGGRIRKSLMRVIGNLLMVPLWKMVATCDEESPHKNHFHQVLHQKKWGSPYSAIFSLSATESIPSNLPSNIPSNRSLWRRMFEGVLDGMLDRKWTSRWKVRRNARWDVRWNVRWNLLLNTGSSRPPGP